MGARHVSPGTRRDVVDPIRIERTSLACKARALPLSYGPLVSTGGGSRTRDLLVENQASLPLNDAGTELAQGAGVEPAIPCGTPA